MSVSYLFQFVSVSPPELYFELDTGVYEAQAPFTSPTQAHLQDFTTSTDFFFFF